MMPFYYDLHYYLFSKLLYNPGPRTKKQFVKLASLQPGDILMRIDKGSPANRDFIQFIGPLSSDHAALMITESQLYEMTFAGSRIIPLSRFLIRADALVVVRFQNFYHKHLSDKLVKLAQSRVDHGYRLDKFFGMLTRMSFRSIFNITHPSWDSYGGRQELARILNHKEAPAVCADNTFMLIKELFPELKEMALEGVEQYTSKYESILSPHDLIVNLFNNQRLGLMNKAQIFIYPEYHELQLHDTASRSPFQDRIRYSEKLCNQAKDRHFYFLDKIAGFIKHYAEQPYQSVQNRKELLTLARKIEEIGNLLLQGCQFSSDVVVGKVERARQLIECPFSMFYPVQPKI